MCEAEDQIEDVEYENRQLKEELHEIKEEVSKMYHFDECFKVVAGCVCAKRFC